MQAQPLRPDEPIGMGPAGMGTCGDYMEARRGSDAFSRERAYWEILWVWGYMSRSNRGGPPRAVRIPASSTLYLWLEKYRREHPLE